MAVLIPPRQLAVAARDPEARRAARWWRAPRRLGGRARTSAVIGLVAVGLSCGRAAGAQRSRDASAAVRELLGVREITGDAPLQLSPDGAWVAYSIDDHRRRRADPGGARALFTGTGAWKYLAASGVFVTNTRTAESIDVTHGVGAAWGGSWSPDGSRLAFYWDSGGAVRLWVWELSSRRARRISDVVARPVFARDVPRWSGDGRQLVVKVLQDSVTLDDVLRRADPDGPATSDEETDPATTAVVFRSPARAEAGAVTPREERPRTWAWYLCDLAVVDVASGDVRRIARDVGVSHYWLSPTGDAVAYTQWRTDATTLHLLLDLVVVSLADGTPRTVARSIQQSSGSSVTWSPDGRWLAYTEAGAPSRTVGTGPRGDCYVVSAAGGPPRDLTTGEHPGFGGEDSPPLWDGRGEEIYLVGGDTVWAVSPVSGRLRPVAAVPGRRVRFLVGTRAGQPWMPDGGRALYVATLDPATMKQGIARIDLRTRAAAVLREGPISTRGGALGVDAHGGALAYVAEDVGHPTEVWLTDASLRRARRVTNLNPGSAGYAPGESRLVEWLGADGRALRGALLLPADYRPTRRYPLVVLVYGGEAGSESLNVFGLGGSSAENMQLLATRGYAVLYPDTPLRVGHALDDLESAVLPGVNRVIELGVADPGRLAIMGHSYGGYSTLGLITRTRRFKAAVSSAGPSDLFATWGRLTKNGGLAGDVVERGQGGMAGTPWTQRDRYLRNSPFFELDRVTTPVLVVQGELDVTVPAAESDRVFAALKRLGVEAQYVRYGGEGHALAGYANLCDYWTRVIAWFDRHLEPRERRSAAID